MAMKLTELARVLDCPLDGEGGLEISGVQGMETAEPGQITFLSNPKYAPKLKTTRASAVIAGQPVAGLPTLVSGNPYLDFARALEIFYQPPKPKPGIHPSAWIAPTAVIGEGASIGPFVAVGENVS